MLHCAVLAFAASCRNVEDPLAQIHANPFNLVMVRSVGSWETHVILASEATRMSGDHPIKTDR